MTSHASRNEVRLVFTRQAGLYFADDEEGVFKVTALEGREPVRGDVIVGRLPRAELAALVLKPHIRDELVRVG